MVTKLGRRSRRVETLQWPEEAAPISVDMAKYGGVLRERPRNVHYHRVGDRQFGTSPHAPDRTIWTLR
jgi:hypothetical protein